MKIELFKKVSVFALIMAFSCIGFAQQQAQFSQYMFNRLSYNPAYAGSVGSICFSGLYRNQWMGLTLTSPGTGVKEGATPQNILFSFDMPVNFLHGGIGLSVLTNKLGYYSAINIGVDYAYRFFTSRGSLAIGVEANISSGNLDYANLVGYRSLTGDVTNPIDRDQDPDPILQSRKTESDMVFDAAVGVYYTEPGRLYLGLSAKNLLGSESAVLNYKNARSIYAFAGYDHEFFDQSYHLLPSLLIKTADFSTMQLDVSCLLLYQNTLWLGASYRIQDAVSLLAGVNWKNFRIGIAYDLTTSKLGTYKPARSKGSLELYLKYCFKITPKKKIPSSYINSIYFM
ncbi:MAG: type IX secretion system membrane protein PorP/SprF [Bacteroidales bacterium]|nr:type IX secretion system membrane protein PorP/SprF [Bacteroidales bacterium]